LLSRRIGTLIIIVVFISTFLAVPIPQLAQAKTSGGPGIVAASDSGSGLVGETRKSTAMTEAGIQPLEKPRVDAQDILSSPKHPSKEIGETGTIKSGTITVGNQNFQLDDFNFYDAAIFAPEDEVDYQDTFTIADTTYINWEMWLYRDPDQDTSAKSFTIKEEWYDQTGGMIYNHSSTEQFEADCEYDWFYGGYGFEESGQWEAGTYQVKVYINNNLVHTGSFTVTDDSTSPVTVGTGQLSADFFQFYDGAEYEPDSADIEYRDSFSASATTQINWELWLNRADSDDALSFTISEYWYGPNGQEIYGSSCDTGMEEGWDFAYYYSGCGLEEINNWTAGVYEVKIYIDDEYVTSGSFSITNEAGSTVSVQGVSLSDSQLYMVPGGTQKLVATVEPSNVSNSAVEWKSTAPAVATVDANGLVTAVSVGETTIVVTTEDGNYAARCQVTVSSASQTGTVYRALLAGNGDYDGEDSDLEGPPYDLERMGDILAKSTFNSGTAKFTSILKAENLTCTELESKIRSTFAGAKTGDVSYFYYSGHGSDGASGEGPYICTVDADGAWMSVHELESILSSIPGTKVVLLDCCYSGGMIGRSIGKLQAVESPLERFNSGVISIFQSASSQQKNRSLLTSDQFKVMTACNGSQTASEGQYSNLYGGEFTVALVLACGYENSEYRGDINQDCRVTLNEAYQYTKERVYDSQVQVYPQNDDSFTFVGYSQATVATQVQSVQLNKEHLILKVGGSETLTATVMPSNATNKSVSWESTQPAIATVSSTGTVCALKTGSTDIKVITEDGNKTAVCSVVVQANEADNTSDWGNAPSEPVAADKRWTITFNQEVDETSILEKNIYVCDQNGNILPQLYVMGRTGEGKQVTIIPVNSYTAGATYYLWIKNVESRSNTVLKNNVRMPFTISQ